MSRKFGTVLKRMGVPVVATSLFLACGTAFAAAEDANKVQVKVQKRTIAYVDIVAAGAMQRRFYSYFTAGADALGWEVILQDGAGDPTKSNTAAVAMLNQGIDALVVSCADSAPMRPALQLAKSKGIPTIQVGCAMTDENAWDASFPIDDVSVGRTLGDYVAKEIGENAEIGILGDTTILAGKVRADALKAALESSNPKIVGEQSISLSDPAGATRKTVSTYLTANPDIKAIFAIYDFFAPPAGNTIKSAGKADTVNLYSFYADAVNVPYMRTEGSPLKAVADGPVEVVSLLAIDQLLGHFEAKKPFDSSAGNKLTIKYDIFTQDNLPPESADYLTPYPVEPHLAEYVKKWSAEYAK